MKKIACSKVNMNDTLGNRLTVDRTGRPLRLIIVDKVVEADGARCCCNY